MAILADILIVVGVIGGIFVLSLIMGAFCGCIRSSEISRMEEKAMLHEYEEEKNGPWII
jgi:hypothetical protein